MPRSAARTGPSHAVAPPSTATGWGCTTCGPTPRTAAEGLSSAILAHLLEDAAATGALTAYLQVRADNAGALALYDSLGFSTHHAYRYLAAPPTPL